jgi:Zinc dependent phospholipase C
MRTRAVAVLVLLFTLTRPAPAAAWGLEVHKFITARAIALLPAEIRPFFEKYQTTVVEHSIDPDLWRTAGFVEEPPRHFVDMDAYGPYPFKELPHDYDAAVKRYGLEFVTKNGTVPWRTEEMYKQLVEAFRQSAPYSRENIKFFAAVVSHYTADAHVPFHAALNYDGQLTGQSGIHSRFESDLFARYQARLQLTPKVPAKVANVRELIFDSLVVSFSHVQAVLDADKAAVEGKEVYDDGYYDAFFAKVKPIVEQRLADSIGDVVGLITAAWVEAGRPPVPLEPPNLPKKVRR